jgi:hypothetical protein
MVRFSLVLEMHKIQQRPEQETLARSATQGSIYAGSAELGPFHDCRNRHAVGSKLTDLSLTASVNLGSTPNLTPLELSVSMHLSNDDIEALYFPSEAVGD